MKIFLVFCVCFSVMGRSAGTPIGVGAYSIQDSSGNRYEGTYHIKDDGQAINDKGEPVNIPEIPMPDFNSFFPDFFRNFGNSLEQIFDDNFENQQKAFDAANKALELTSSGNGFNADFVPRWGGSSMSGDVSAYSLARIDPSSSRQVAAINPPNPDMPNVNFRRTFTQNSGPGVYSVSSRSSVSSVNVDGKQMNSRSAQTVVNRNGDISTYSVHD